MRPFTISLIGWSACSAKLQLRACHGQVKAPKSVWLPYQLLFCLLSQRKQCEQAGCAVTDESRRMTASSKDILVSFYMRVDKLCAKHPPSSRGLMSPDYLSPIFVSNAQFSLFLYFRPNGCLQHEYLWLHRFCISKWRFHVHEGRRAKTGFARW